MIIINVDKLPRITKNKKRLEKELKVKISTSGKDVSIVGESLDEFEAEKVIRALNFGFPYSVALLIKTEEFMFEAINIKEFTNSKNLERVRGRIIGTQGKTLQTLSQLTGCYFELKDNEVGIIGPPENMKTAEEGLRNLIRGTKTANIYKFLEKNRPEPIVDLGLKD